jgi:transposase InsO family protein
LRTYNGGEYTSKEFVYFCKLAGVRRELILPHNPQQNGVAERKNRSIEETVKALMKDQGLSMYLWGEATMTTIYVHNITPHCILKDMTPEEAFSGKKTNVEHLMMQEHLSTSTSQPASHVIGFKSRVEERGTSSFGI